MTSNVKNKINTIAKCNCAFVLGVFVKILCKVHLI